MPKKVDKENIETPKPIEPELKDIQLKCVDCTNTFIYSAGEQKYYKDRGLAIPKRCHKCRIVRRKRTQGDIRVVEDND